MHLFWKEREGKFKKIFIIALILIALGMIGTFPPLFEAFFEAYEQPILIGAAFKGF